MKAESTHAAIAAMSPEDVARGELYAFLGRIFCAGPDAALLNSLAGSSVRYGGDATALGRAWAALAAAADSASVEEFAIEHAQLFVGTGQAPVSIYASHYLLASSKEHTLVGLRDALPELGLARLPSVTQPEDHLGALLEVMRHLVRRGDGEGALAVQRTFFNRYLGPVYARFCDVVEAYPEARFYRIAASLLRVFMRLEDEGFALE